MLTSREKDVMELVAEGLPDKTVAVELDISRKTVRAHLQAIFRKLGCTNRTAATRIFLKHIDSSDDER